MSLNLPNIHTLHELLIPCKRLYEMTIHDVAMGWQKLYLEI